MRGLVQFQASVSLNGFIAGPNDDMDWIFDHVSAAEGAEGAEDMMAETGAILAGRRTYEVGRRASRHETSEPYGGAPDPGVTFVSGDVADAVRAGLAAAGDRNLAPFGADVLAQCLARGLVEELALFVIPVLLGAGVPLFRAEGVAPVHLEQISSVSGASFTALRSRVVK